MSTNLPFHNEAFTDLGSRSGGQASFVPISVRAQNIIRKSGESDKLNQARLGQISFINCLPVVLPLERQLVRLDANVVMHSPAHLNAMFEAGKLDVSAMSSSYFLSKPDVTICPRVSISCKGPVGSVLLFSKCDISDLHRAKIVVTAQSAASVNLLKVLCAESLGFMPRVITDADPDLANENTDAVLVIGDRALAVDEEWSSKYYRLDLGAWWHDMYGLPMVFGVWAARSTWAQQNPEYFETISGALATARDAGLLRRFKDTLFEAYRRTNLSLARLEHYYKHELNFDFGPEHRDGLALFQKLLKKHYLL